MFGSRIWRPAPAVCALGVLVASSLGAAPARADVASWLYVGGGVSRLGTPEIRGKRDTTGAMQIDAGFGTTPARAFVVGGLLRMHTHFERGTDLGLLVRTTTGGYSRGDFGLALDFGGYQRWWDQSSSGGVVDVSLGAPWGLTLVAGAMQGTHDQRSYTLTFGIDLARLTVHRTTGDNWFVNPYPSPRRSE